MKKKIINKVSIIESNYGQGPLPHNLFEQILWGILDRDGYLRDVINRYVDYLRWNKKS